LLAVLFLFYFQQVLYLPQFIKYICHVSPKKKG
jgi:hypothetical protein